MEPVIEQFIATFVVPEKVPTLTINDNIHRCFEFTDYRYVIFVKNGEVVEIVDKSYKTLSDKIKSNIEEKLNKFMEKSCFVNYEHDKYYVFSIMIHPRYVVVFDILVNANKTVKEVQWKDRLSMLYKLICESPKIKICKPVKKLENKNIIYRDITEFAEFTNEAYYRVPPKLSCYALVGIGEYKRFKKHPFKRNENWTLSTIPPPGLQNDLLVQLYEKGEIDKNTLEDCKNNITLKLNLLNDMKNKILDKLGVYEIPGIHINESNYLIAGLSRTEKKFLIFGISKEPKQPNKRLKVDSDPPLNIIKMPDILDWIDPEFEKQFDKCQFYDKFVQTNIKNVPINRGQLMSLTMCQRKNYYPVASITPNHEIFDQVLYVPMIDKPVRYKIAQDPYLYYAYKLREQISNSENCSQKRKANAALTEVINYGYVLKCNKKDINDSVLSQLNRSKELTLNEQHIETIRDTNDSASSLSLSESESE